MKKNLTLLVILLLAEHLSFAQFKGMNVKKLSDQAKSHSLRTFQISPPEQNTVYVLSGKIPGKAEYGFITYDASDKHSFLSMARYWNKQKKIIKNDDYAMKSFIREFTPPKGYEGLVVSENFEKYKDGIIYSRKYARAFNEKEQDTIEMTQVTYVAVHPKIKNETIAMDLIMIGDVSEIENAKEEAKKFISNIIIQNTFYNKNWVFETSTNTTIGLGMINTDLAYMTDIKNSNGASQFLSSDFNTALNAGPLVSFGRNTVYNIWIKAGIGLIAGKNNQYDSLYSAKEIDLGYYTVPVIYNVTFKANDLKIFKIGLEKRFFFSRQNSINIYVNFRRSFGSNYFELTGKSTPSGPLSTYRITYNNSSGFDAGAIFQHYFKYHHWGINGGVGYTYGTYKFMKYYENGTEQNISTAPYFLPKMKTLNYSGFQAVAGFFYQF